MRTNIMRVHERDGNHPQRADVALPGIDGMLDSAHSGAAFGLGAAFPCGRRTACATVLHCR
jgi:hypothetical protein